MLADLERLQLGALIDDVLQAVALELATLVELETLQVATYAGELLKDRVGVVDVVEQETLQATEVVHTRRDHVRIDALETEHAQRRRVQVKQQTNEFDDLELDEIVRGGRVSCLRLLNMMI